ncbi:hypothetical protein BDV96DRAFT_235544 [Lophiotrema nucula]|uniref:Alcohol dehydrogenase-like C-terminal domain-containing protein n=1 Tax=Lophiotrema nucula TaxID=690887 RepID=A0A6A5YTJ2_9PLEO|nr:hypothetical protein BDV96DRAFT_235544 [Lophiotrema nucula]
MHAAVVEAWGEAPKYKTFDIPEPSANQVRIKVIAAGVHNLVRSRAAGKHFSVAGKNPPHVPGTDGVGTVTTTGELVYFNALKSPTGPLAEEINIDKNDIFPLSKDADPDTIAVLANPAMSSWMALAARAGIKPGGKFTIGIVGATGVSGQTAVQIAKAFGATEVVAIGKPGAKLEKTKELGATSTVALAENINETDFSAAADVDVVLDYLWGDVTKAVLPGIVEKRKNKSQRLTWVEIGAITGDEFPISAALLRKANVAVLGCGPGSWTFGELNEHLPTMLDSITKYGLKTEFAVKQLADVESWWNQTGGPRALAKP